MSPAGFNLAVLVTEKGASQATGGGHTSEVREKETVLKKIIWNIYLFRGNVSRLCLKTVRHQTSLYLSDVWYKTHLDRNLTDRKGKRIECYPQNIFSGWWLSKDLMKCHKKRGFPISSSIRTNCVWEGIYKLRDNQPFRSWSWCSPAPRSNYQSFL